MMYEEFNEIVSGNEKSTQFNVVADFMHEGLVYEYDNLL